MPDVRRTIDAVWKLESAKIVGGLARLVHDVGLAEEFAQDALVAALEQWQTAGIPDNPGAWLTTVARRRAVAHIRRERRTTGISAAEQVSAEQVLSGQVLSGQVLSGQVLSGQVLSGQVSSGQVSSEPEDRAQDDVLRLVFVCCHPALPRDARVALTLR